MFLWLIATLLSFKGPKFNNRCRIMKQPWDLQNAGAYHVELRTGAAEPKSKT